MAKKLHDDVRNLGLDQISNSANWAGGTLKLAVCMSLPAAIADITNLYPTGKRIGTEIALAGGDVPITNKAGGGREIIVPGRNDTAQATVTNADTGTATSGGASTLTDTAKAWTASEHVGWVVHITAGTGAGQRRVITANTATQLTVDAAWTTQPDATSVYTIRPDNVVVIYDSTRILVAANENQDSEVASGTTLTIPAITFGFGAEV